MSVRTYRLGRRADRQAETRLRIVDAAVELHSTIGPAATSISAVAERAGVQRHTVYAHFPTDAELFTACSAHWRALHPFPDATAWTGVADPRRRLRRGLADVYAWYEQVEEAYALFTRDSHVFPPFWTARRVRLDEVADVLAEGLPRRRAVRAAIGHALEFETWRSLVRGQGLSARAAIELLLGAVESAAGLSASRAGSAASR